MSAYDQNIKVNVNNYLAHEYNEFKNDLYRLAPTNPDHDFEIRKNLLRKVECDQDRV